ncbi:hypothetical protein [Psychroflexus planctonicus]|uniref:Tetratricopeptide repeat protein n=1 Tax=Psychroflexus planctonicus TaxID=1526575 RepID=A0ABQ1SG37_9FLAO|nr:hypothetical protein [Psychroflexus planctonicus]GGE31196.1 hypothetical protein GCM10010832_09510 [Psychroflexus planctonicus]
MFGGGGSIQGMITSLSNNKKLLRSKRLFHKEHSFLKRKQEYVNASGKKTSLKKATKEELLAIRKKVIKERKKQNLLLLSIFILLLTIISYLASISFKQIDLKLEEQKKSEYNKKEKEFLLLVKEGDEWFKKGNWYNSVFKYEKAIKLFPENYDISYRLVNAYSFQCENDFENCQVAKKLLDELFFTFPNKKEELLEIKDRLHLEYQ